ncbi:electron transfer flavoprotein subunit alpha/FixB family protein [Rahnella sp. Lac-M11]|uniref:Electron transfer flavoprotein subunit alpha/FixB family protein n=1 Tax=Rahnella contaminans TaxID=2703882 RepID=A0A6M2B603_9GAMM|nr:electron transfer flavoprotein subunit alpha/FixB family protein [Rahnella contaminans]NGX88052.1 electron transfer flavoprotein subunit alpha/FixB family protein [Rahnella contaminans]
MNIAIILDCRQRGFLSQAQMQNDFLRANPMLSGSAEMWLLYDADKPDVLPQMACDVRHIVWISLPENGLAEPALEALTALFDQRPAKLLLCASGEAADELATRLAFRIGGVSGTGVVKAERSETHWRVVRPAYGSRMWATRTLNGSSLCISVAATGGKPARTTPVHAQETDFSAPSAPAGWLVDFQQEPQLPDNGLHNASAVLVIGQGAGSAEQVRRLEAFARQIHAEPGCSRPVAMNAWCEMSRMVGISGVVAAPDVCIVAGASGAAALMAGIDRSEFIVAINTDPHAAIFAQADVGIVDDLDDVLSALAACYSCTSV